MNPGETGPVEGRASDGRDAFAAEAMHNARLCEARGWRGSYRGNVSQSANRSGRRNVAQMKKPPEIRRLLREVITWAVACPK